MQQNDSRDSRRVFLRAAGALGLLAIGGEAALGRSLRFAPLPGASQDDGCECTLQTFYRTYTHTFTHAKTVSVGTKTWTHTRTAGTATQSYPIGQTATETNTVAGADGTEYSVTLTSSLVATPPVTGLRTVSYGPGGATFTVSVPSNVSVTASFSESFAWWVHCKDCDGEHDSDQDGYAFAPGARAPQVEPIPSRDVLDARTRYRALVMPALG